jgi:hypothetical protein
MIRDKYKKRKGWIKVSSLSESKAAKEIIINLYDKGIKIDEVIWHGSYLW